jgi:hypothetical protein
MTNGLFAPGLAILPVVPALVLRRVSGIWVKPGRERDDLTTILKAEGFSPVWMDHTLVGGFVSSQTRKERLQTS